MQKHMAVASPKRAVFRIYCDHPSSLAPSTISGGRNMSKLLVSAVVLFALLGLLLNVVTSDDEASMWSNGITKAKGSSTTINNISRNTTVHILCLGDSLTNGGRDVNTKDTSYPAQLQQTMLQQQQQYPNNIQTHNLGHNGATAVLAKHWSYGTTGEYKAGVETLQQSDNSSITITLLMLGTNDAMLYFSKAPGSKQFVKGERLFVESYEAILDAFATSDATIVAIPPWISSDARIDAALTKYVIPKIKDIAKRRNLPLVDMREATINRNGKDDNVYVPDGIHLTPNGYGILAQAWMAQINQMIVFDD